MEPVETSILSLDCDTLSSILDLLDKESVFRLFNTSKSIRILFGKCFYKFIYFSKVYEWMNVNLVRNVLVVCGSSVEVTDEVPTESPNEGATVKKMKLERDLPINITYHKGIEKMCIRGKINKPLELPKGLKKLTLLNKYTCMLKLPDTLEELTINGTFNQTSHDLVKLPPKLKKLTIMKMYKMNDINPDYLPKTLEELTINFVRDQNRCWFSSCLCIPPSVKTVKLTGYCDNDISHNNTVEKLKLDLDTGLTFNIPYSVKHLEVFYNHITKTHDKDITFDWEQKKLFRVFNVPSGVEKCIIGYAFDGVVNFVETKNLVSLVLHGNCYIESGYLPDGLIDLKLGNTYKKRIHFVPKSLKYLTIPRNYKEELPEGTYKVIRYGNCNFKGFKFHLL